MDSVKTAISLKRSLFDEVDELAKKKKVPRSQVFVRALEEYLRREENRRLLEQINNAYSEGPDPEEEELRRRYRNHHRRLVEGEW